MTQDWPNIIIERAEDGTKTVCLMGEAGWVRLASFSGDPLKVTEEAWAFAQPLAVALNRYIGSDFGLGAEKYAAPGTKEWKLGDDMPPLYCGVVRSSAA